MRLCLKSSLSTNKKCEKKYKKFLFLSLGLESSFFWNKRHFFGVGFSYYLSSESSFLKYQKKYDARNFHFLIYKKSFNLGAWKFYFVKYNNFFSFGARNYISWNIRNFFLEDFFYFFVLELKRVLGSPLYITPVTL